MVADLEGPLEDFYGRTNQIRAIITSVEYAIRNKGALSTEPSAVDVSIIGLRTGNTANAMSLVFLASSFEEFFREEIGQCSEVLAEKYSGLNEDVRHSIRGLYWTLCLERLRTSSSIIAKTKPKSPDVVAIDKAKKVFETAQKFALEDNSSHLDKAIIAQHSRNFKPHVVDEIAARIGVKSIIADVAENIEIKKYFGTTRKKDSELLLRSKLNEFYDRRNEIVHSLNAQTGYAADVIMDYINLFELTSKAIKNVLEMSISSW